MGGEREDCIGFERRNRRFIDLSEASGKHLGRLSFSGWMRQALHAQYHDESLRLVYSADDIRIEQSSDPLRRLAARAKDAGQARRLLAIVAVLAEALLAERPINGREAGLAGWFE